jgi:lipopolysaccharide export LptBFGC system permease protein LptF
VEKSQQTGLFIMIGSAFMLVFFLWAMLRKSYAAVALPVASALAVVTALAFWIGWTLFTGEEEDGEELEEEGVAPSP